MQKPRSTSITLWPIHTSLILQLWIWKPKLMKICLLLCIPMYILHFRIENKAGECCCYIPTKQTHPIMKLFLVSESNSRNWNKVDKMWSRVWLLLQIRQGHYLHNRWIAACKIPPFIDIYLPIPIHICFSKGLKHIN